MAITKMSSSAKTAKFKKMCEGLKKKFSDSSVIVDLNTLEDPEAISTSSIVLDQITQIGGIPRGRISEIYGHEATGKTTIAAQLVANVQREGGIAAFLDFEQAFFKDYAAKMGVSFDENKFHFSQPKTIEEGEAIIHALLDSGVVDLIVVDSVSAMTPRSVMEGDLEDSSQIGLQARMVGQFLTRVTKFINESNTALLLLNQVRSSIKKNKWEIGPDFESSGGKALRFYASMRILLEHRAKFTEKGANGDEVACVKIKATCTKNKLKSPWRSGEFFIRLGEGTDNDMSIFDIAYKMKIIAHTSGGKYLYKSLNPDLCVEIKGKDDLKDHIRETPELLADLRNTILGKPNLTTHNFIPGEEVDESSIDLSDDDEDLDDLGVSSEKD